MSITSSKQIVKSPHVLLMTLSYNVITSTCVQTFMLALSLYYIHMDIDIEQECNSKT